MSWIFVSAIHPTLKALVLSHAMHLSAGNKNQMFGVDSQGAACSFSPQASVHRFTCRVSMMDDSNALLDAAVPL